jgi:hypothetical protein
LWTRARNGTREWMAKRATRPRKRNPRPVLQVVPTDAIMIAAAFERLVALVQKLAKPPAKRRLPARRARTRKRARFG